MFTPTPSLWPCRSSLTLWRPLFPPFTPSTPTHSGHMWPSGYVVAPLGAAACRVGVSLRADPKGWVPAAVVNLALEAIPLHLPRLRACLARLPAAAAARLAGLNALQARGVEAPPRPRGGGGGSGRGEESEGEGGGSAQEGGGGEGGEGADSDSGDGDGWETPAAQWSECEEEDEEEDGGGAEQPHQSKEQQQQQKDCVRLAA